MIVQPNGKRSYAFLLCLVALGIFSSTVNSQPSCAANGVIIPCGGGDVDENSCEDLGCCYDQSGVDGQSRCYQMNAGFDFCNNNAQRITCENGQTSQSECEGRGCCWDPSQSPSCFFTNTGVDQANCPADTTIESCESNTGASDRTTCEGAGCCWLPRPAGATEGSCFRIPPLSPTASSPTQAQQSEETAVGDAVQPQPELGPDDTSGVASPEEVEDIQRRVRALQGGETIEFEDRTYFLTETLRVEVEDVTFQGLGPNTQIVCPDGMHCIVTIADSFTLNRFIVTGDGTLSILSFQGRTSSSTPEGRRLKEKINEQPGFQSAPHSGNPGLRGLLSESRELTQGPTAKRKKYKAKEISDQSKFKDTGKKLLSSGAGVSHGSVITARNINLEISDSEFDDGSVTDSGGVLFASDCDVVIVRSNLTNNEACISGGAVSIERGSLTVEDSQFTDNTATRFGGAVNAIDTTIFVTNTSFEGNSAGQGGAIFVQRTTEVQLQSVIFITNTANDTGGAMHLDTTDDCQINDSTFERNTAVNRGGAILVSRFSSVAFISSIFVENLNPSRYEVFVTQNSMCTAVSTPVISNNC